MTYGAGGSSRQRTRDVVSLGAQGDGDHPDGPPDVPGPHAASEIAEILDDYRAAGIENILALGGDIPGDPDARRASDYTYASDLLDDVDHADFSIGVAAHPRSTPARRTGPPTAASSPPSCAGPTSPSPSSSSRPSTTSASSTSSHALGVDKPVLPGIMPITNAGQVRRMAQLSGAAVPAWLVDRLDGVDDPAEVRRIGVERGHASCAPSCSRPGRRGCTSTRSTAARRAGRSTPTSGSGRPRPAGTSR